MTCDNCSTAAIYRINSVVRNIVHYCEKHLPEDLKTNAALGIYALPTSNEDDEEDEEEESSDS
jgi:NAD(P)H-dependent FMN reductase